MSRLLCLPLLVVLLLGAADAQAQGTEPFYEVEALNPGLGPLPPDLNLETPQAMMETFIFAGERGAWETAAQTLDLSHIPEDRQARLGPILASQLFDVVRRGMWLDWSDLSDRPDAVATNTSSKHPLAGEARRNIRLAILELPSRPVSIRIARLNPAQGDPVWLFSGQTVRNIPEMHEVYGPTEFERALPDPLRQRAFWTLSWWEVLALPVILLGAIFAGVAAYKMLAGIGARVPSRLLQHVIVETRVPVALLVFVGVFSVVRTMLFTFSGVINTFLTPLSTLIFVLAVALLAVRAVDAVLERVVRPNLETLGGSDAADERDLYTNISAIRRVTVFVAFLVGAALVLLQINAFQTLGFSLLASAGAIGLILAFAARTMLANVMASLQIAFSKSARIGDAVLFDGQWCYVERINFTYLQLQSWDNRRLMVPVSEFVSRTFENWSKKDASILQTVELRLDHRADVDRLREAFGRFVEESDDIVDVDETKVQVIDHDASGMVVRFYARAEDPVAGWNLHCRLRETMLRRIVELEAEGSPEPLETPVYLPRAREVEMPVPRTDD